MSAPANRLRPLNVTDLIDEAIRLYRRNFRLFVGIGAPLFVPLAIVQLGVQLAVRQPFALRQSFGLSQSYDVNPSAYFAAILGAFALFVIVTGLIQFIFFIAVTYAASERLLGRDVTIGQAYRATFRHTGRILLLSVALFVPLFLLFITIIGGPFAIYLAIAWMFSFHVVLLEGSPALRSLGRSRSLVRGHWWRVLGIFAVVSMITWIVQSVFSVPVLPLSFASSASDSNSMFVALSTVASVVMQTAASVIVEPITYCCWLLLYYDLRVRKEGFDLELMAQEMMPTPQPAGSMG